MVNNELEAKQIRPVLDFLNDNYDRTERNGISFSTDIYRGGKLRNCVINKEIVHDYDSIVNQFGTYMTDLAKLQILALMNELSSKVISNTQKNLNKILSKKSSVRKLLKGKKEAISGLFWIERFVNDVVTQKNNSDVDYESVLVNDGLMKITKNRVKNSYQYYIGIFHHSFKKHKLRIESFYSIYDRLLKTVESSTNLHIVRATLIVSSIAALISLLALLFNDKVIIFLKSIFNGIV